MWTGTSFKPMVIKSQVILESDQLIAVYSWQVQEPYAGDCCLWLIDPARRRFVDWDDLGWELRLSVIRAMIRHPFVRWSIPDSPRFSQVETEYHGAKLGYVVLEERGNEYVLLQPNVEWRNGKMEASLPPEKWNSGGIRCSKAPDSPFIFQHLEPFRGTDRTPVIAKVRMLGRMVEDKYFVRCERAEIVGVTKL